MTLSPMADIKMYQSTGRKYPSTQIENSEWAEADVGGTVDYNGLIYLLDSVCGTTTPTAHGASSTAKDWVYTPTVTGASTPRTYTIEQGDSATPPARKVNYGIFTEFGYKGDRKAGLSLSSKLLAQGLQSPITMTGSPTAIALAPLAGKHLNVYLDSTSAALGTTQLLRDFNIDFAFTNVYGPSFPFNRSTLGWTTVVDTDPGCIVKLLLGADSQGMAQLVAMQTGATQFLRVQGQGLIIDNLQTLTFGGGVTGGTFTLSYKGQTTAPITYAVGLTPATVNTAFQLLSGVGANCTVGGSNGGPYTFTFSGPLASDMSPVTSTNVSLSGGTPTMTLVAQAYNIFQHDMAIKLSKPNKFSDKDGTYAIEWEFTIVEDTTWGKAQTITVTNLLTAL
jgi:hypothetical protein